MAASPHTEKIVPPAAIRFFLLAFGITWGLSILATDHLLPVALPAPLRGISAILLHYGPALAALILVGKSGGRRALRSLLGKLGHWRVAIAWYFVILLYPMLLRLAAVSIDVLLGGQWPSFLSAAEVPAGNPLLLVPLVFLAVFLQAGLAEEIGWRGYALPALQQRYGAVVSSLILGMVWWLWHFHPLNFANLWPVAGFYLYNILSFTILLTWVYNNTQGSILLVALFHTASNVSDWIVPTFSAITGSAGLRPFIIQGTLGWLCAIGVIVWFGAQHLQRPQLTSEETI